jgi:hypothetical protein
MGRAGFDVAAADEDAPTLESTCAVGCTRRAGRWRSGAVRLRCSRLLTDPENRFMKRNVGIRVFASLAVLGQALSALSALAGTPRTLYGAMRWRLIGPFRGGRVCAVVGVPGRPDVFYMNAEDGGLWKSDNSGATWASLFVGR